MIWILVKEKEGQLPREDLAAAALFCRVSSVSSVKKDLQKNFKKKQAKKRLRFGPENGLSFFIYS